MTKPTILEEVSLNTVQLKKALDEIKKRDEELNFRSQKTEEYLQQATILTLKDHDALLKGLEELNIPRLKDTHFNKIIDLLPKNGDNVKLLFQGQTISISDDNAKKIASVVEGFLKK